MPPKTNIMSPDKSGHVIQMPVRKRLFTIPEAAEYLGRSVWAVRELVWAGQLPSVRVGRRVHLDIHDLDQWIEKNKVVEAL